MKELFNSLPKEEQENYKRQGQHMYSVDYTTDGVDPEKKLVESAAYIGEGLKSGLLPSQLEPDEISVMRTVFGTKWFEKYGFTSEKD
jgi:hypothetical protein